MTILLKDNPTMTKAHQRYIAFTQDDQARMAYESRIAFQRDIISGKLAAELKGKQEGKQEVARAMKDAGMSKAQIAGLTGLAEKEIEGL